MSQGNDQKKPQDRSQIYDGWVARPADNTFWEATNAKARVVKKPPEQVNTQVQPEGPAPTNM